MSIPQETDLKQAAIELAAHKFRIFPLTPLSKRPFFKDWPWQDAATDEIQFVEAWWHKYPTCNIGLVADNKLTIIDVDRKAGKADGWLAIGDLIDVNTPWVKTPNNGWHFYYQCSPLPLRKVPGVDIQSGRKYVVVPPSILPTGVYQWGKPLGPPWATGIAPTPVALVERLQDSGQIIETAADCPDIMDEPPNMPLDDLLDTHVAFLQTGAVRGFPSRSELLHSLGYRLYRLGYTDEQVLSMLLHNPYIHDAAYDPAHNGSQSEVRARNWVWTSLKKLAIHRRKQTAEWAIPARSDQTPHQTQFAALRDRASQSSPGEDIRPLLKELAVVALDAYEEDQVLGILHRGGTSRGVLNKLMAQYRQESTRERRQQEIEWKHTVGDDGRPLGTIDNLRVLLARKQACLRHNLMNHRIELTYPSMPPPGEEWLNIQLTQVRSWAAEYRLPIDTVPEQMLLIAQDDQYHPFQEWVGSRNWDGQHRLAQVLETVRVPRGKEKMRDLLITRWLISIVASVWGYGNRPPRGVLTFTGPQQKGKTTWLYYLVPKGMYHQGLILRPDQRDSATKGLRYLIVEIGEIGTTFRRSDIDQLKSYIGQRKDSYRLAYARDESEWQRRTVFAASANSTELLHDQTGNTRWWVLETESFDLDAMEKMWGEEGRGYELQQFWLEIFMRYRAGESWDLTEKELIDLDEHLGDHMDLSPLATVLLDTYDWQTEIPEGGYPHPKRETDIKNDMEWGRQFTPAESRELRELLKKWTGQKAANKRWIDIATVDGKTKKTQGRFWYVPPRRGSTIPENAFKPG